ncbi:hypothetical protein JL36_10100 [Lactococcus cremoris]|nr:hypothetical protein JL36_10100 [Lactococcus cremoris]
MLGKSWRKPSYQIREELASKILFLSTKKLRVSLYQFQLEEKKKKKKKKKKNGKYKYLFKTLKLFSICYLQYKVSYKENRDTSMYSLSFLLLRCLFERDIMEAIFFLIGDFILRYAYSRKKFLGFRSNISTFFLIE